MRTLKLQFDYVLARNIPQSDIRKSRAVWDVAFDSHHRPVLLSFKIRFHKRNRGVPLQPKIDMAGLKDDECRRKFRQHVSMLKYGPGRSLAMRIPSQSTSRTLQGKRSRFYCRGRSLPLHLRKQNPHTIVHMSLPALVTSIRKSVLEGNCAISCNKTAITSGRLERWSLRRRGRTGTRGKPTLY
ncbi:hypothetical protein RB195_005988 [Necator americanus]|uniref:Endonuclease/exonuclease/phosphatase domain-containing protein n=1 Tax=Necator americanus TaxID=51031 RepID=A0ABR1BQI6_NECAM